MVIATETQIVPFDYQLECLEILERTEKIGRKKALVILASGLGKTILSALFVKRRYLDFTKVRCLFLCHQNDVLQQAQLEYEQIFQGAVNYGFFHGEDKSGLGANILFASLQTMRDHLEKFDPNEFDVIIVDETHHIYAETYVPVVHYFQPEFLLGITATPDRMDELDIRDIYGEEVYNLPLIEALIRGLLTPIDYRLMTDEISLSKDVETPLGKLSIGSLNRTMFIPKRDDEITRIIQEKMYEVSNPRVMIFCSSIEHCEQIAGLLPNAVPIHSRMNPNDRKVRLELFKQGMFNMAVTVDMFNEALNIPEANVIVFLRSTQSMTVYLQQLGRGLRPQENKPKVLILDFVGNCERISFIYNLWEKITQERGKRLRKGRRWLIEPFLLNVDAIDFKEKIFPLIDYINNVKLGYYSTWQEASVVAMGLGIKGVMDYKMNYRKDPRLPGNPHEYYEDFPGFPIFLESKNPKYAKKYSTWQEASEKAVNLEFVDKRSYRKDCKLDSRLPKNPDRYYKDFPGWLLFLQTDTYKTCNEAAIAARKLGIRSCIQYSREKLYKQDPKLPAAPDQIYTDFPGWEKFLGTDERDFYKTWQEASIAAIQLGIKNGREYSKTYGQDPFLPFHPSIQYKDFPGWSKFLGKK